MIKALIGPIMSIYFQLVSQYFFFANAKKQIFIIMLESIFFSLEYREK